MKQKKQKIIAVTNQKGGVSKTTTAQALARELAKEHRVLLIDFDGQATLTELVDLTTHFDKAELDEYMIENNAINIFERKKILPLDITGTIVNNGNFETKVPIKELHFIPSPGNSLGSAAESASGGKDMLLKKFLDKIGDEYDYVVIDSLPGVSTLFKNVLYAADVLVIPIQTKTNAMAGSNGFLELLNDVAGDYDKVYDNIFILPTMYNKGRKDDNDTYAEIRTVFLDTMNSFEHLSKINKHLLDVIPERAVFSSAQSYRVFLQDYIEAYDSGKRDILLLIERMTKEIIKD